MTCASACVLVRLSCPVGRPIVFDKALISPVCQACQAPPPRPPHNRSLHTTCPQNDFCPECSKASGVWAPAHPRFALFCARVTPRSHGLENISFRPAWLHSMAQRTLQTPKVNRAETTSACAWAVAACFGLGGLTTRQKENRRPVGVWREIRNRS